MANATGREWTITRQWYEGDFDNGEAVYFYTEIYGLKPLLQGHDYATANFGTFEPRGRHIVHSFYAGDNQYYTRDETFDNGSNDSHMLDDVLLFLIPGNVDFI